MWAEALECNSFIFSRSKTKQTKCKLLEGKEVKNQNFVGKEITQNNKFHYLGSSRNNNGEIYEDTTNITKARWLK